MGIIASDIYTVGKYLTNSKLEIPNYQRPYKWKPVNVIQLIDDISRFKSETPYRIGTIVIHKDKDNDIFSIVDGQQRTITFLLLVKAILLHKTEGLNSKLLTQLFDLQNNLFTPKFNNDISKRNIQKNFNTILQRINTLDESFIDYFLNKCEITYFVIDDISEAFQFFDSQNARGKDLEPHDLLKAFHLRELHSSELNISESEVSNIVDKWEDINSNDLAKLFADFLYRVRGWSKGNSSKYFGKKDIPLFKGITLKPNDENRYPYMDLYKYVDSYILKHSDSKQFPFQLDQTIINGKYFFEMISYYKTMYDSIYKNEFTLTATSKEILKVLSEYYGRNRTGDKYTRMLFDCALIYYVDRFGFENISNAIEKIFIWAYRLRLTYQNLQLVSIDNYVIKEQNIFKIIKESIYSNEIEKIDIPLIESDYISDKTKQIKELFQKMNYYATV